MASSIASQINIGLFNTGCMAFTGRIVKEFAPKTRLCQMGAAIFHMIALGISCKNGAVLTQNFKNISSFQCFKISSSFVLVASTISRLLSHYGYLNLADTFDDHEVLWADLATRITTIAVIFLAAPQMTNLSKFEMFSYFFNSLSVVINAIGFRLIPQRR